MITYLIKSEAFPIGCTEAQIEVALEIFPARRGSFPCTYLGLPLHHSRLKMVHFQPLLDKIGSRLAGWWGKHFTRAGRVVLCQSVFTSMVLYHLAVFKLPKWVIKRIEKIKRSFLWMKAGAAPGSRPHPLVNWRTICRPKELGGLGVLDLERFGRALRLRWPWLAWTDETRPWRGMATPCDDIDMELFRASTVVTLADGAKCLFWLDAWAQGGALRHQFPELFAIATRKRRTVQKEMENNNWIRSLARISTGRHLEQYIRLWTMMRGVHLLPMADTIRWRWTEDGVYTAASAYRCQFAGSCAPFRSAKFWRGYAEAKCRFFAWMALHGKILTADNLAIRGWPHDPICKLCRIHPETVQHLTLDCHFSTAVRERIFSWHEQLGAPSHPNGRSLNEWWDATIAGIPKDRRREASGAIMYSIWGVWKERNRRVFQNKVLQTEAVATLVHEEMAQRAYAHTQDPGDA